MEFDANARRLRNIKEVLLVVSVIYFYTLATLLYFGRSTYGLDHAWVFITISTLFLIAIGLEALLAWWHRRRFITWGVLGLISYAMLGLYIAPIMYGPGIYIYVLLEPLIVTLIGGFAFAVGRLLAEQLLPDRPLAPAQISAELKNLPGWKFDGRALTKSYRFPDEKGTTKFTNRITIIVKRANHVPEVLKAQQVVTVRLRSEDADGITVKDVRLAREIDEI